MEKKEGAQGGNLMSGLSENRLAKEMEKAKSRVPQGGTWETSSLRKKGFSS